MTSLKMHNGEGGQNAEIVVVSIDLKGWFILETLILYNYIPNTMVKYIPMSFGIF